MDRVAQPGRTYKHKKVRRLHTQTFSNVFMFLRTSLRASQEHRILEVPQLDERIQCLCHTLVDTVEEKKNDMIA